MSSARVGRHGVGWTWAGCAVAVAGVAAAGLWALTLSGGVSAALLGPALIAIASVVLGVVIALAPFTRPRARVPVDHQTAAVKRGAPR